MDVETRGGVTRAPPPALSLGCWPCCFGLCEMMGAYGSSAQAVAASASAAAISQARDSRPAMPRRWVHVATPRWRISHVAKDRWAVLFLRCGFTVICSNVHTNGSVDLTNVVVEAYCNSSCGRKGSVDLGNPAKHTPQNNGTRVRVHVYQWYSSTK